MGKPAPDISGARFGRLVVIRRAGLRSDAALWLCQCDCGREVEVLGGNLRKGSSTSCGCFKRQLQTRHGRYSTPEYHVWDAMLRRCENPQNPGYHHYGGRGIRVCWRWHDFTNFFADMGERPSAVHSIDRIDNNGNYEPGNCRWATQSEQNLNQRRSRKNKEKQANDPSTKTTAATALATRSAHQQNDLEVGGDGQA